ncbi:MAG: V-type ATP synthase subunit K [Clostridiales bacterium]|nr:V-type ATP synthase subunit K [Clostridiales bacterium]
MTGLTIGIIGLVLTALLCGIGSGLGLKATGKAAAGVLSEDPSKFSKVIVLSLLPATQGIYGFLIAILGASYLPTAANIGNAAVTYAQLNAQGWNVFWACLPMMLGGAVSAYLQGRTAATTIIAVGKKSEIASKSIIFPAMIEFYALLGLVVSIMMFNNMPIDAITNPNTAPEAPQVIEGALRTVSAFFGA